MSAIEVLKRIRKYNYMERDSFVNKEGYESFYNEYNEDVIALDEAILALEQKEKFVKILKNINCDLLANWYKEYERKMDLKSTMEICIEDNDVNKFIVNKFKKLFKELEECGGKTL